MAGFGPVHETGIPLPVHLHLNPPDGPKPVGK